MLRYHGVWVLKYCGDTVPWYYGATPIASPAPTNLRRRTMDPWFCGTNSSLMSLRRLCGPPVIDVEGYTGGPVEEKQPQTENPTRQAVSSPVHHRDDITEQTSPRGGRETYRPNPIYRVPQRYSTLRSTTLRPAPLNAGLSGTGVRHGRTRPDVASASIRSVDAATPTRPVAQPVLIVSAAPVVSPKPNVSPTPMAPSTPMAPFTPMVHTGQT